MPEQTDEQDQQRCPPPSQLQALSTRITKRTDTTTTKQTTLGTVVAWGATGPLFHFSDTWQLVMNTGTTIVTFLMVFLIQNTQNRDTLAVQVKLAELIIAVKGAKNSLATVEDLSE